MLRGGVAEMVSDGRSALRVAAYWYVPPMLPRAHLAWICCRETGGVLPNLSTAALKIQFWIFIVIRINRVTIGTGGIQV
jgi:hypothetical protein